MYFTNLFISALYCNSCESEAAICKCFQVSVAEICMTAPSNCQRCEGKHESEMTSEEERSEAGEAGAVCRSSAFSAVPESAASHSQSEMPVTDLNPQPSETTVCYSADDTAREDSWRVNIETLPDEILVKIFSHLSFTELIDVVQKVSTRWKRLSQDAELWTNKEYEIRCYYDSNTDFRKGGWTDQEAIQTFCDAPNLRSVCLQRGAKARVFRALCDSCPRLSQLRLHYTQKFSYSVLKNLVEKCSQIHTLRISNELLKCERFSEAVSQLQQLRVLYLDEFYSNTPPVLRPLGDGCPQLAEVDFGWMTLDMDDLRYFLNAKRKTLKSVRIQWVMAGKRCVLPLLTVCADSLERLQLFDFDIVRDEAREAFTALGSLKNLHELKTSLTEPPPPGVAALAFKAGGLPKLTVLDLRDSFGLADDTLIAVTRGCPALRELCIRGAELLTDAALSQLHRLQHLETLDVSSCKGLGGALVPCLTRLPRLHTLCMEDLDFPKLQPGLASIVQLSGLRSLNLSYSHVTRVPFDKFPGKLLCLRELNVEWCRGDPKATEGLTEQMPGLVIHGDIVEEERAEETEGHESDAELAEEENEENAEADEANGVPDGGSGGDGDSDDDSESEGENLIWGERGISDLFLESVNE